MARLYITGKPPRKLRGETFYCPSFKTLNTSHPTSSTISIQITRMMLSHFVLRHVPTLFVATATTFGGLIPFFDAEYAILEFGLPKRVAISKQAQSIMILSSGRITTLGLALFTFYIQEKLAAVDTILLLLGYVGLVDGYVCWLEGVPGKAVFRLTSGLLIAAWGWFGMTEG